MPKPFIERKNKAVLDVLELEQQGYTDIYFRGIHLTGSPELPNNHFLFGELNKDNTIKQDMPTYQFSPKDKESVLGRLLISYKNDELYLLNYSIKESSLNIKLQCLNKQSLDYEALALKTLEAKESQSIKAKQSKATLHALLENQDLECIHGGKVILKSNKGKNFKDNNIPLILESDLLNSSVVNCPYSIAGIPTPCTKVINVKGCLSQKKINNEYAILQELIPNSLTDKGFALKVSFVPTKFKFDYSFNEEQGLKSEGENKNILNKALLRLYYKEHTFQQDNLLITKLYLNDTLLENKQGFNKIELNATHLLALNDLKLLKELKQDYIKDYEFKQSSIQLGKHIIKLIFIIPKNIPKLYKEAYKEYEYKEYGVGEFKQVYSHDKDYKQKEYIIHTRAFLTPICMQKLDFEFAQGLDDR